MSVRYGIFLYYSLINLASGEICPINTLEFGYLALEMIFSSVFFTVLFSDIVSIYSQLETAKIMEQQIIDQANELMNNLEFQTRSKLEINHYMQKTAILRGFQNTLDGLLCSVCYSLQIQTMSSIYFRPMVFSNQTVQLYLLRHFRPSLTLKKVLKAGFQFKYLNRNRKAMLALLQESDQEFDIFVE